MTDREASIDPSERVRDYTDRFRRFLEEDVAPVESSLTDAGVGTPSQPRHDGAGRMHAGHVGGPSRGAAAGRRGRSVRPAHRYPVRGRRASPGWRCTTSRSSSTVSSGLGLGLAALAWTEGPSPACEHFSDAARQQYLLPLVAGPDDGGVRQHRAGCRQ